MLGTLVFGRPHVEQKLEKKSLFQLQLHPGPMSLLCACWAGVGHEAALVLCGD